jgi:hypothetical protein
MPTWLAALVTVAVIIAVYLFCIRPMRRGSCAVGSAGRDPELTRQIAELREELRVLREEDHRASDPSPQRSTPRGSDS